MERLRNWLWIFMGLLLGIAATVFILQNPGDLTLTFAVWTSPPIPLWATLLAALLIGFLAAHLLNILTGWTSLRERWNTRRRIRQLQDEVTALRNLPLANLPDLDNPSPPPTTLPSNLTHSTPTAEPNPTTPHTNPAPKRRTTTQPKPHSNDPYASIFAQPDPADAQPNPNPPSPPDIVDMNDSSIYPSSPTRPSSP